MKHRRIGIGWLGLAAGVIWAGSATWAAEHTERWELERGSDAKVELMAASGRSPTSRPPTSAEVSLSQLPANVRDPIRRILDKPTLSVQGPTEVFIARPATYHWLLDHPDRASRMWHRLGAKCLDITERTGGAFGWADGQGSDVHWKVILHEPRRLIWYAEGKASPGTLLPAVPMRAVVVLHYHEDHDSGGHTIIHQQADLYLHTDSKTAALVAQVLGSSADQMAEQGIAQLEMFFSALAWYLDRHPERELLLLGGLPGETPATNRTAPPAASEVVR